MNCKYCNEELKGSQRKFCNDNHKGYYYRQQKFNMLKGIKEALPDMFKKEYEWNDEDTKMLKLFMQHKVIIKDYINLLLEGKNI